MSSYVPSSLPAPALQASKAALNAALSDIESSELDEGQEIEVDMALQAETLKTVFNDPKNFNVKVCVFLRLFPPRPIRAGGFASSLPSVDLVTDHPGFFFHCTFSIRFIPHGRCGLTRLRLRVAICHRPQ